MILDKLTEFADAEAVAGAAGTRNVGDVIDIFTPGGTMRDIGNGRVVYAAITIDAAPTGADTVEFLIVSDAADPPATDGSATQHASTGAIAIADLPIGKTFCIPLPLEGAVYEQFLGFQVANVGASSLADLQVSAGLTLDPHGWKSYPDAEN